MSLLGFIENDNLLTVDGVQDTTDDSFINTATVTASLKDAAGVDVPGQTFPLALTYVAASDGKYQGLLEDTLTLAVQTPYTLTIDIDAGAGLIGKFEIPFDAITRGAC